MKKALHYSLAYISQPFWLLTNGSCVYMTVRSIVYLLLWHKNRTKFIGSIMSDIDHRLFQTSALQATIYTPDMDHSPAKVMKQFFPKCADTFGAAPESLPNLPGLPPEVPRVIFRDEKNIFRLEIAASRINYFKQCAPEQTDQCSSMEFFDSAVKLFTLFKEEMECRVARLAAVRTVFAYNETPGLALARHFCKDTWEKEPLNRPESFELHSHKIYTLIDDFTVNSWARNKTGTAIKDNQRHRIIVFEQDLNTLAESINDKDYSPAEINQFYDAVKPEFDNILCQYYPENKGD